METEVYIIIEYNLFNLINFLTPTKTQKKTAWGLRIEPNTAIGIKLENKRRQKNRVMGICNGGVGTDGGGGVLVVFLVV